MDSTASLGAQAVNPTGGDSIRDWIASLLSYLELRLKLIGLESREAGAHLLVFALLLVSAMLIVFLLYLMMLILHWAWGWSALALAAVLLLISIANGSHLQVQDG